MTSPLKNHTVDTAEVAGLKPTDETKLSASESRRQGKAAQAAAKKEANPQQQQQEQKDEMTTHEDAIDPRLYFENRCAVVREMRAKGINPYPHKFHITMSIPEFIEKFSSLKDGEHLEDQEVSLAGSRTSTR